MSDQTFYVRGGGSVSGPFDSAELKAMAASGQLHPNYEVSRDQVKWYQAGTIAKLFPHGQGAPPAPNMAQFNYQQGENAYGPVTMHELQRLATSGELAREDLIWQEGDTASLPADRVAALAPYFANSQAASALESFAQEASEPSNYARTYTRPKPAYRDHIGSPIVGVIYGGLFLLILNAPWFWMNDTGGWWWKIFNAKVPNPSTGLMEMPGGFVYAALLCFYYLLGGIALIVVPLVTKGFARGITLVGIGVLGMCMLIGLPMFFVAMLEFAAYMMGVPISHAMLEGLTSAKMYLGMFSYLAGLMLSACVISVAHARARAVDPHVSGRIVQTVIGGFAAIFAIINLIVCIIALTDIQKAPAAVWICGIVDLIGYLGLIASSVISVLGVMPTFSKTRNMVTTVLAAVSIILLVLSLLIQSFYKASEGPEDIKIVVSLFFLRLVILALSFAPIAAVGLNEVLISRFRPKPA